MGLMARLMIEHDVDLSDQDCLMTYIGVLCVVLPQIVPYFLV